MSVISFIVSALGATAVMALIGGGIEFFTIRRLYGNSIAQILLTVGFMFIIAQVAVIIWGPAQFSYFIRSEEAIYRRRLVLIAKAVKPTWVSHCNVE